MKNTGIILITITIVDALSLISSRTEKKKITQSTKGKNFVTVDNALKSVKVNGKTISLPPNQEWTNTKTIETPLKTGDVLKITGENY